MTTSDPRRATLAELGQRLSHGILHNGKWSGDYSFRRPTVEVEIAVDDAIAAPELADLPGKRLLWSLRVALDSLCGRRMQELTDVEAMALLSMLPYPDVLLLAYARFYAKNATIPTGAEHACQRCGAKIPAGSPIQVGGMEVEYLEPWREAPTKVCELREPVEFAGLGVVKSFTIKVPTFADSWGQMTELQMRSGLRTRYRLVEPAIIGTDQTPVERFAAPSDGWLAKGLLRSDYEVLETQVLEFCGGVRPAFPLMCPKCKAAILFPFRLPDLGLY